MAAEPYIDRVDFLRLLERSINRLLGERKSLREKLQEVLKAVRGVEVEPHPHPHIRLFWGREPSEGVDVTSLIEPLGELSRVSENKPAVIVFDEAQEFRKLIRYDLRKLFAYVHDHVENVKIIVTGSQFGFLQGFLKLDDPKSPLFGRYYVEVKTRKLTRDESIDFLEKGFAQIGVKPEKSMLEEIVYTLDGVIGWLTYVGAEAKHAGRIDEKTLKKILMKAVRLATQELENFLKYREEARKRYLTVLEAIASGNTRWSEIKEFLERREWKRISTNVLANILRNLQDANIIEKTREGYRIADPVLELGVREILKSKKKSKTKSRRRTLLST